MDDLLVQRGEEREIRPGVTLSRGTLGNVILKKDGRMIGWLHASFGEQWNAYRANGLQGGIHLGRFTLDGAVTVIIRNS